MKTSKPSPFKELQDPSVPYLHFDRSVSQATDDSEPDETLLTPNRKQDQRYDVEEGALIVYDRRTDREIGFVKDLGPGG